MVSLNKMNSDITLRAKKIKLVLTDSDGVLTDTGVYYSEKGEELKKFSIRDGMGVERLRKLAGIDTGIITGELSDSVRKRAEKLSISELYMGVKDKIEKVNEIINNRNLTIENIAFIGDDTNDEDVLRAAGLSACPSDAIKHVKQIVHFVCENKGGQGAFRDLAEMIISAIEK